MGNDKEGFKEGELLNLMEILKDDEVKARSLLIKVYDVETKKEGWISFEQIINNLASLFKTKTKRNI